MFWAQIEMEMEELFCSEELESVTKEFLESFFNHTHVEKVDQKMNFLWLWWN